MTIEEGRRPVVLGRLRLVGDMRGDDDELADGVHFQIPETTKRHSILNLKEAVLWGTADAVNPTDYLNAYDFLDVLDRQKLGVYAAAYSVTSGPLSQVFVIVPAARHLQRGRRLAELLRRLRQHARPAPGDGLGEQKVEAAGVPGRVDPGGDARRRRGGAPQEDLRVKDGFEHAPPGAPRR